MDHIAALKAAYGTTNDAIGTPSIRSKDSPSLWNTSINQGWSTAEEDVLCKALMKFGVGNWRAILDSGCLPGKNPAQMYLQTQRILGQQSISEFTGLHVDCKAIGALNKARKDVVRKNRLITNLGVKLDRQELTKKVKENKEKFEVPKKQWSSISLPQPDTISRLIAEKRSALMELEAEVAQVREMIIELREDIRGNKTYKDDDDTMSQNKRRKL
ncbi:hypothetical protein BDR26DRAFT_1005577 [Obelidium mucronatum]|nr:hypothetical protein BDR26DRAFT_1005577 [Obelidium mucronatum]